MNTTELNRVLSDEIYKLRAGKAKPDRVNAVVRAAGTIVAAARLEVAYCKLVGARTALPFFGAHAKNVVEAEPAKPATKRLRKGA